MVIQIPPEIEAAIAEEAKTRGVPVDALIQDALEKFTRRLPGRMPPDDWDAGIEEILDSLPALPVLRASALTRDAIYGEDSA